MRKSKEKLKTKRKVSKEKEKLSQHDTNEQAREKLVDETVREEGQIEGSEGKMDGKETLSSDGDEARERQDHQHKESSEKTVEKSETLENGTDVNEKPSAWQRRGLLGSLRNPQSLDNHDAAEGVSTQDSEVSNTGNCSISPRIGNRYQRNPMFNAHRLVSPDNTNGECVNSQQEPANPAPVDLDYLSNDKRLLSPKDRKSLILNSHRIISTRQSDLRSQVESLILSQEFVDISNGATGLNDTSSVNELGHTEDQEFISQQYESNSEDDMQEGVFMFESPATSPTCSPMVDHITEKDEEKERKKRDRRSVSLGQVATRFRHLSFNPYRSQLFLFHFVLIYTSVDGPV